MIRRDTLDDVAAMVWGFLTGVMPAMLLYVGMCVAVAVPLGRSRMPDASRWVLMAAAMLAAGIVEVLVVDRVWPDGSGRVVMNDDAGPDGPGEGGLTMEAVVIGGTTDRRVTVAEPGAGVRPHRGALLLMHPDPRSGRYAMVMGSARDLGPSEDGRITCAPPVVEVPQDEAPKPDDAGPVLRLALREAERILGKDVFDADEPGIGDDGAIETTLLRGAMPEAVVVWLTPLEGGYRLNDTVQQGVPVINRWVPVDDTLGSPDRSVDVPDWLPGLVRELIPGTLPDYFAV